MKTRLFLLALISQVFSIAAHAFTGQIEIDGINYDVFTKKKVATVIAKESKYTGDIVIPSSIIVGGIECAVTNIGDYAFQSCSTLNSILIPEGVTTIGAWAFSGCSRLITVSIPLSVIRIGYNAFNGTAWYINQSDGLVYAGLVAYKYKGTISENTSIVIRDGTKGIAAGAFESCKGLTSVTIPSSVTIIGSSAFAYCRDLTFLTIPSSVTSVGVGAFKETAWYDNQPDGLVYIGSVAYQYKSNWNMPENTNIVIREQTTEIGDYAFNGCNGLTTVTIPSSVTRIGDGAFSGCGHLSSVMIPSSITTVGSYAFEYCGLTSVTIPSSVITIGGGAFAGCSHLTCISVDSNNPFYDSRDGCNAIIETTTNTLIAGCENSFIPSSINSIGYSAFSGCSGLTSIIIPSSVTRIWDSAFSGCSGLTSIIVDSNNNFYDSRENCNAIIETSTNTLLIGCLNTTIPSSITCIGAGSFHGCFGLTSVTIPSSVSSIGVQAFSYCLDLTSVTIPSSVTTIGELAFCGCLALTDLYCYAKVLPITDSNVFDDSSISNSILRVPASVIESYRTTVPWSGFGTIVAIDEPVPEQCATPTITFINGKVKFTCETEGVEFVPTVTYEPNQTLTGDELELGSTFTVSVFARREGYLDSEVATKTITMASVGDVNADGQVTIADVTSLVNAILGK